MQRQLSPNEPPIQIIDITDLKVVSYKWPNGEVVEATPRDKLEELIRAIAEQEPKAIGVAIDFSPDAKGYITPVDEDFFEFCMSQQVPVFLGVSRTANIGLPPEVWLGSEKYESLAVSTVIPKKGIEKMPSVVQAHEDYEESRTMSSALADTYGQIHCKGAEVLQHWGLAEQFAEHKIKEGKVKEFVVDYSPLQTFIDNRLKSEPPTNTVSS